MIRSQRRRHSAGRSLDSSQELTRTEPDAFVIERTESQNDGSTRVYVRLTLGSPPSETWEVAIVLTRENAHSVVDDVVYLRDKSGPSDVWLSRLLSDGCDGHVGSALGSGGQTPSD